MKFETVKKVCFILFWALVLVGTSACSKKTSGQIELSDLFDSQDAGAPPGTPDAADDSGKACETVWVHICGEVNRPGVYEVECGARICDVLDAAGGFSPDADESYVNLAQKVQDGMQVVIPSVLEAQALRLEKEQEERGLVDINRADAETLCGLPGIGESRARAIIAYREEHGGFSNPEEIMQVSGIGQAMYEKFEDRICVGVKNGEESFGSGR